MPDCLVSLGSSFAAGPGLRPLSNTQAMRSTINYPSILAKALSVNKHIDLTVSGATLLNILTEPQTSNGVTFQPQLNQLPADADIVTVTAGGNDLGYVGGIVSDEVQQSRLGSLVMWLIGDKLKSKEVISKEDIVNRFIATIDAIRAKAPHSKILLVEYLTLFGTDVRPGKDVWMNKEEIQHHRELAATLQDAYASAARQRKGVILVSVAQRSEDHGIGSNDPWVEGWTWKTIISRRVPFHPNERGMEAVADMVKSALSTFSGHSQRTTS